MFSTLSGLFASILYNLIFYKKKNHSKNFVFMMTFGALTLFFGNFGIYFNIKWLFIFMYVINGIFTFPIIPFLMEKTSVQFKNISLNIINLSKTLLLQKINKSIWFFTYYGSSYSSRNFRIIYSQI